MSKNSFSAKKPLSVAGKSYEIFDITALEGATDLPYSLKVLLENLLRTEDGANITAEHIKALASWDPMPLFRRQQHGDGGTPPAAAPTAA